MENNKLNLLAMGDTIFIPEFNNLFTIVQVHSYNDYNGNIVHSTFIQDISTFERFHISYLRQNKFIKIPLTNLSKLLFIK